MRIACFALFLLSSSVLADDAKPPTVADPFESATWCLTVSGYGLIESWNFNLSREMLLGLAVGGGYTVRRGLMIFIEPELGAVSQRSPDAVLVTLPMGARWRIAGGARRALFVELGAGPSMADVAVPPRGTRFNYIVRTGVGLTWRTKPLQLVGGLRWLHLSNNSLAGRDRNPDVQTLGVYLGMLFTKPRE